MENVMPSDEFKVSIPDKEFRKVLTEKNYIDFIDGTVSYGVIKGIKEINLRMFITSGFLHGISGLMKKGQIQSLEGIQFFTALTELNCENNQLTSLDVSQNTA
jgi:hypothetical protein